MADLIITITIENEHSNGSLLSLVTQRYFAMDIKAVRNIIKKVVVRNCQITTIDMKFPNVEIMDLSDNLITKMDNLDDLKSLTSLNLSNNKITEIGNLDNCDNLKDLDLSHNLIEKVENLRPTKKELVINLSNNKIKKMENFPDNTIELYLKNNLIEYIENLPKKLLSLVILGNDIKEIKNINFQLVDLHYESTTLPQRTISEILFSEFDNIIKENQRLNDRIEQLEEEMLKPDSVFIKELAKIHHETGEFRYK